MANYPALSAAAESLPLSIFARLYERVSRFEGDVIPFHIGDTHLAPPTSARLGALGFHSDHAPLLYGYSSPTGDGLLLEALVDKVRRVNNIPDVDTANLQITCGATHALSCTMRAVMDPGDDMLLLAPYWPLIRGLAMSCSVNPVEAPFSHVLLREPDADPEELLERCVTPQTTAMYVCNPNNPDGKVFTEAELDAVARVAQRHDLWVIADEVYEHFTYDGHVHHSIGARPGMLKRTMTAYSFSKSYGQAGLRVGYVAGPKGAVEAVRKMCNHTVYSVPRAMQRSALAALTGGDEFLSGARADYLEARDHAVAKINAPCQTPQGCTYLFLDLGPWIATEGACSLSVLERLAGVGVLLAPGAAFGHTYSHWARLCFSSVPFELLDEGIDRLNRVLGKAAAGEAASG